MVFPGPDYHPRGGGLRINANFFPHYLFNTLSYSQGQIITLEVEDFDMEPGKDYVLIRDGEEPTDRELAVLTGISSELFSWVESRVGSGSVYGAAFIRLLWFRIQLQ